MPAGIDPVDGVIPDVAVPIQRLRIPGFGDDGVGTDEPPEAGVIVPGVVVVEAVFDPPGGRCLGVLLLAGEAVPLEMYGVAAAVRVRMFPRCR